MRQYSSSFQSMIHTVLQRSNLRVDKYHSARETRGTGESKNLPSHSRSAIGETVREDEKKKKTKKQFAATVLSNSRYQQDNVIKRQFLEV